MSHNLVIAETSDGKLKSASLHAIAFAKQLAQPFQIFIGSATNGAALAAELGVFGAEKILLCENAALEPYIAEQWVNTAASAATGAGVVIATATSFGKDLLPRLAAKLDASYAADCISVSPGASPVFERPTYAGNAISRVSFSTSVVAATVRQSEIEAATPSGGQSPVENIAFSAPSAAASRVEFLGVEIAKSERPELSDAKIIVSGGRALKEQFFDVLDPLASALGAGIGASRAACDAGYAPGDLQVGQTGKIVAPNLYFAIGISGAIQHVAGMKNSKVIVAINKDPEAPIFQVADYGLVADLFEAVPALTTALKAR